MAIDPINDLDLINRNWRAASLSEVKENMEVVEEADTPVAEWAKSAMAMANMPDNVTYEMTGGSVEEFTNELNNITTDGLNANEVPPSGQTATYNATPEAEENPPVEETPNLGEEDQVNQPLENTAITEEEEVPEENPEEEQEFSPEREEELRQEFAAQNPDVDVNSLSLDEILRRLGLRGQEPQQ